jgi:hypothetical protein
VRPRSSEPLVGRSLVDERGQARKGVGVGNAVLKIAEKVDPQFPGGRHQGLKAIPGLQAFFGACLQAHIALAHSLAGSQFSRIVMQKDFGMDQHQEQLVFLGLRQSKTLIQLLVASRLPKELVKLRPQSLSLLWMQPRGLQLVVQLPEVLPEGHKASGNGQESAAAVSCNGDIRGSNTGPSALSNR